MVFGIVALVAVFIIAIYLFLLMPRVYDKADMELLRTDFAHRGLWNNECPENSLAAFSRAVEAGFGIELDIQLSADNKIMVFHDYDLKRMCGVDKKLSELKAEELRQYCLAGSSYNIPTLAEVLQLVDGKVPLLIELKGEDGKTELCRRAAAMLDKYHGAFCIESFNPLLLCWFKKFRPRYARGQLVTKVNSKTRKGSFIVSFGLTHMLFNFLSRPDFIAVDGKIRKKIRIILCDKLFKADVFVWTVRTPSEYNICEKEGRNTIFERFLPQ